ncbi:MAG TPA: aminotransferase class V-fold PLP-dependent enzyme [Polyangiaceae bacterium]|nr:aminotransferase class V-fold PLP-dependent enzyme [Polyangiaceae bacterium]
MMRGCSVGEHIGLGEKSVISQLQVKAYLGYAAIAPVTACVSQAVQELLDDYAHLGGSALGKWLRRREMLRAQLARLIGANPEHVALAASATCALRDLAFCLPWQAGDCVLVGNGEFPGNVLPWQNAAELFSLRVQFLPQLRTSDDDEFLSALEACLRAGRVRLVALSAVQFQTGIRTPLESVARLCRAHGAELAVDAIQACGVVPLDVTALGIDYLAGGAHKWLMALEGAGFLYAKPSCAKLLVPRTAGWLSHEEGVRFLFEGPGLLRYDRPIKSGIQFMEGTSANVAGYAALEAALAPILQLGVPAIFDHVSAYLDELEAGLLARGLRSLRPREAARRSGILSFEPPAGLAAADVVAALHERGVYATMPDGLVRFAPHFPNSRAEIPLVLAALDSALSVLSARA